MLVDLVSPAGTTSRLWSPHNDPTANLRHRFASVFCWGEPAAGTWRVRVADSRAGKAGRVLAARLELSGSLPGVALSGSLLADGGFVVEMAGNPGVVGRLQRSADLASWEDVARVVLEGGRARVVEEASREGGRWYRWNGD